MNYARGQAGGIDAAQSCLRVSAIKNAFAFLFALSLSACVAPHHHHHQQPPPPPPAPVAHSDSETVLIHYYVIPGHEAEFQQTLYLAWQIYQSEHLVLTNPHVVVREIEPDGKTRFDEILTWVSHSTPEHASDTVKSIWDKEQSLCESRNGHGGLNGGEVELVMPAQH
ncbi:MAG TPA: hypothetical protein VH413_20970 [Verrucomicrobiae bacterium]|nr:hypothetical protein [Verrucomicrobiae bacterium]